MQANNRRKLDTVKRFSSTRRACGDMVVAAIRAYRSDSLTKMFLKKDTLGRASKKIGKNLSPAFISNSDSTCITVSLLVTLSRWAGTVHTMSTNLRNNGSFRTLWSHSFGFFHRRSVSSWSDSDSCSLSVSKSSSSEGSASSSGGGSSSMSEPSS